MQFSVQDLAPRGKPRQDSVGEEMWELLTKSITRIIIEDYLSTLTLNGDAYFPHLSFKLLELGCLNYCTSYIIL